MKVIPADSAEQFAELIARYKVQNPVKYAAKKAELEKKLASLKGAKK